MSEIKLSPGMTATVKDLLSRSEDPMQLYALELINKTQEQAKNWDNFCRHGIIYKQNRQGQWKAYTSSRSHTSHSMESAFKGLIRAIFAQ